MPVIVKYAKSLRSTVLALALPALPLGMVAAIIAPLAMALTAPAAQAAAAPAATAAASGGAPGLLPGGLRVAVIDTEKILLSSQAGKKAIAELKKLQDQKETELRGRQQEIKDLQEKLSQGKLSLAQDKIAEMAKQLEDREIALRRLSDDANRDLTKKKDDMLGSIDEKVMPVINLIGKEQGYTMIFRKFESGLIYADDAIDITQTIIQRLDAAAAQK